MNVSQNFTRWLSERSFVRIRVVLVSLVSTASQSPCLAPLMLRLLTWGSSLSEFLTFSVPQEAPLPSFVNLCASSKFENPTKRSLRIVNCILSYRINCIEYKTKPTEFLSAPCKATIMLTSGRKHHYLYSTLNLATQSISYT